MILVAAHCAAHAAKQAIRSVSDEERRRGGEEERNTGIVCVGRATCASAWRAGYCWVAGRRRGVYNNSHIIHRKEEEEEEEEDHDIYLLDSLAMAAMLVLAALGSATLSFVE